MEQIHLVLAPYALVFVYVVSWWKEQQTTLLKVSFVNRKIQILSVAQGLCLFESRDWVLLIILSPVPRTRLAHKYLPYE